MKAFIFSILSVFLISTCVAQTGGASEVGKVVYYEGKVELGTSSQWAAAKIDSPVFKDQSIRIPGDGMAEILWNSGVKSVVGPESSTPIKSLLEGSASGAKVQTKGSFDNFKSIFSSAETKKRTQEGGIRREEDSARQKPAKDEIYWKESEEVHFNDAYSLYEAGNYSKAITVLHDFIDQKPDDENIKYAFFALGHSYIMTNNTIKAKEIFERFAIKYSGDELAKEAELISSQL